MPSDSDGLPGFSVGERLTADDLNKIVERLRSVSHDYANDFRFDLPALLSGDRKPAFVEHWIGIVAATTAFNAVYSIKRACVSRSANVGSASSTATDNTFPTTVRAVNIAELDANGQGLSTNIATGTRVQIFVIYARDSNQSPFYFFDRLPQRLIPVLLSSTGSDGTATSKATYVYSARDADNPTFVYAAGGTIAVAFQRPFGSIHPAAIGLLKVNGTNVTLWWADEYQQWTTDTFVTGVTCNGDGSISVTTNSGGVAF